MTQKHILSFILVCLLALHAYSQTAPDPNLHIYICFGQSNMEGQGTIHIQDKKTDDRFLVFQSLQCNNLSRTKAQWYVAVPPTCQCHSGLSPADYFGKTMAAYMPDSIRIGIINVAVGGCDIRLFDKDIYQNYTNTYQEEWFTSKIIAYNGNPYNHLIELAQAAQADGVIKGILLHQGESNTGDNQWTEYVKKIYENIHTDLQISQPLPILAGEVVQAPGNCCASMNSIIRTLPTKIDNAHIISSKNCPAMDNAHFNSEGYRTIGTRYATKMLEILGYASYYAEAECGTLDNTIVIEYEKDSCSNEHAIRRSNTTNSLLPSSASYTFSLSTQGIHYIYARIKNTSTDSTLIRIEHEFGSPQELYLHSPTWNWVLLDSLYINAYEATLQLQLPSSTILIDKIVLKNSPIIPKNKGEEAIEICNATSSTNSTITPAGYELKQNYPNPTQDSSTIEFSIAQAEYVSIMLYNSKGKKIKELAGNDYSAGTHNIHINYKKFARGVYFYTLRTKSFTDTKKLLIQ